MPQYVGLLPGFPLTSNGGRCFQCKAAREDGKSGKKHLLGFAEQVVAPGDGVAHRALTGLKAVSADEQRQPPLEPVEQSRGWQHLDPHGDQLDCQRQAVQPSAESRVIEETFSSVKEKPNRAAWARATNSRTASDCSPAATS